MTAPRYPIVVFDLDGTLVDSYDALTGAVNHVRSTHGLAAMSREEIRARVGDGLQVLLERSFTRVPPDAVELFEARYDEICCREAWVLDDVEATLEQLEAAGIAMAVCTNKPTSFSRKILEHFGIARHFAEIVGPDLAGARKPDARHVEYAIGCARASSQWRPDASDALFVGDMPIDVDAARNTGIAVAVIATGSSSLEQLEAAEPDYVLERFSDLVHLVTMGALERV